MASFAQEKEMRAHLLLIEEAGTYAGYFSQGTDADGDVSAWYLTNNSDKAAADTLLDAKVAELTDIGNETAAGEGPSDFDGYTPIHFDDDVAGADYRAWFVDVNGDYFKADNGNSDTITAISDADEIATLLTDSGYIV
jgi:hypothetical protein|tara:strand:+ start:3153 stop:3566 length:414 start_codon:yes stop_codon:yes gene_type:complete